MEGEVAELNKELGRLKELEPPEGMTAVATLSVVLSNFENGGHPSPPAPRAPYIDATVWGALRHPPARLTPIPSQSPSGWPRVRSSSKHQPAGPSCSRSRLPTAPWRRRSS